MRPVLNVTGRPGAARAEELAVVVIPDQLPAASATAKMHARTPQVIRTYSPSRPSQPVVERFLLEARMGKPDSRVVEEPRPCPITGNPLRSG
jgi:hypothetical protein